MFTNSACYKCQGKGTYSKGKRVISCSLCLKTLSQRFPFDHISSENRSLLDSITRQRCDDSDETTSVEDTQLGIVEEQTKHRRVHFLVVGGGIGGFATSIVLLKLGFKVTLIEKDASFEARKQGYGLTLQQGMNSIRTLGLDLVSSNYSVAESLSSLLSETDFQAHIAAGRQSKSSLTISKSHYVFDPSGKVLGFFGSTFSKYFSDLVTGKKTEEELLKMLTSERKEFKQKTGGKFSGSGKFNVHIPRQECESLLCFCYYLSVDASFLVRRSLFEKATELGRVLSDEGDEVFKILWNHKLEDLESNSNDGESSIEVSVSKRVLEEKAVQQKKTFSAVKADFIIACDGIYSSVWNLLQASLRRHQAEITSSVLSTSALPLDTPHSSKPSQFELKYLGCMVILGISFLHDPFLYQRVFETNDGITRIYVMPFKDISGSCLDSDPKSPHKQLTMWQLSFKVAHECEAENLSSSPQSLLSEALQRMKGWHSPLEDLIRQTPLSLVSGHPVYDRETISCAELQKQLSHLSYGSRLFFLGDSIHPMSPFKGQGANQALLDATLLGKMVLSMLTELGDAFKDDPHAFFQRVQSKYHEEMLKRSEKKVLQSREAADVLHSEVAIVPTLLSSFKDLSHLFNTQPHCGADETMTLGEYLQIKGITARSGKDIDKQVVLALGYGSRPHLLHQNKVKKSRCGDCT